MSLWPKLLDIYKLASLDDLNSFIIICFDYIISFYYKIIVLLYRKFIQSREYYSISSLLFFVVWSTSTTRRNSLYLRRWLLLHCEHLGRANSSSRDSVNILASVYNFIISFFIFAIHSFHSKWWFCFTFQNIIWKFTHITTIEGRIVGGHSYIPLIPSTSSGNTCNCVKILHNEERNNLIDTLFDKHNLEFEIRLHFIAGIHRLDRFKRIGLINGRRVWLTCEFVLWKILTFVLWWVFKIFLMIYVVLNRYLSNPINCVKLAIIMELWKV